MVASFPGPARLLLAVQNPNPLCEFRTASDECTGPGNEANSVYTTCAVIQRIVRVGGRLAVVAPWQSTGGSIQRCPRFNSRPFHFAPFCLMTSKFIDCLLQYIGPKS